MRSRTYSSLPAALLVVTLPVVTVACGGEAAAGPAFAVRDSAGVTIVENSGSVPEAGGWQIFPEPEVAIGTFEGDSVYQFFQVRGGRRLADGRIVVVNGGSGEIRLYDGQGHFLRAHGRMGEGPGEYQAPSLAGVLGGDTLVVVDGRLRRVSLVHADDGFIESSRVEEALGGYIFSQGLLRNRTILTGGGFSFSSDAMELSDGHSREPTSFKTCNLDGTLAVDYGEFPGSDFYMRIQSSGGSVLMSASLIPFGKSPRSAASPDYFFYGSGDAYEIRAYDPSGGLARLIRLDRAPRPVTEDDIEAYITDRVESLAEDEDQARSIRQNQEDMPTPDFLPAHGELLTDALGYLWVQEYPMPGDRTRDYLIYDPQGALVGSATLPADVSVLEIGDDYVLGLYRDELEVEYVHLYRLARAD